MTHLSNRSYIVTGASRGFGLAITRALLQAGANVGMMARNDEALQHAVAELDSDRVVGLAGDVADAEQSAANFARIRAHFGALHGLVNNAGLARPGSVEHLRAEDVSLQVNTNFLGTVFCCQAAIPLLRGAENARMAEGLGTRRTGSGVVIDASGLVLTVGYLIMESSRIFIASRPGETPEVAADFIAYDHPSGLGLARARAPLDVRPIALGDSDALPVGAPVIVASYGGAAGARPALLVDRREFAGYWEYLLENALFAAPPHPLFGGAALIDASGALLGIGSLVVNDARTGDEPLPGNMFIPINRLKPILGELLTSGRGPGPSRPWLGLHSEAVNGRVVVRRVAPEGPAEQAGLMPGAIVTAVSDAPVSSLAAFYRALWASGDAGAAVRLTVLTPGGELREVTVQSGDRLAYLRPTGR